MGYKLATQEDMHALRTAAGDAIKGKERAVEVIRNLKLFFDSPDFTSLKLQFDTTDAPHHLGTLTTAFGKARFKLRYTSDENGLVTVLVAEKETLSNKDESVWTEVSALYIPQYNPTYLSDSVNKQLVELDSSFSSRKAEAFYILGMQMYHGIVKGS